MNRPDDTVYSVWLYGSRARGDFDNLSDLDIFVAGALPTDVVIEGPSCVVHSPSVSQYSWTEIETMAAYGSLFLHHLRLEGRLLFEGGSGDKRLKHLLEQLPPYRLFRRDIRAFHLTVEDVRESISSGSTPEFELSVLGAVIRHASVLGCYLIGNPCFGRTSAVERVGAAFGFTRTDIREFDQLYLFHLHENGRCEVPFKASWEHVEKWSAQVTTFLDHLQGVADAFEERLSTASCESQS